MTKPKTWCWWGILSCIIASLSLTQSIQVLAEEDDDEGVEEIVVTGSYIKRDSFDSASPMTIIDQTAITDHAAPNLGEVMTGQTFNYGSDFQTNTYAARGQGGVTTTANLRGLGSGATLNLIDGKRSVNGYGGTGANQSSNLNNALPQIAIGRIEILKDGASAIYGTDAVAGVVNLITRKNFSGSKFSALYQQDSADDFHEELYDFIIGSDTENGHITFAASFKKRNTLEQTERPEYLRRGFERSGTGNPGEWRVPLRDASGNFDGARAIVDPGCGAATSASSGGEDVGAKNNYLSGESRGGGTDCAFHFGETWNYMNPNKQWTLWSNFQYRFSDNLSNELDMIVARLTTDSRGSPQNPGGRTEEFPIVPGDHPGNPFRAIAEVPTRDTDGDGTADAADGFFQPGLGEQLLFAQDADSDGIPDRGTVDLNGDGLMDVILSATPFTEGPNSIAFNEDVDVTALRIFGKIGLLPGANQPSSLNPDGSNTGNATYDSIDFRLTDTLTYAFPDSEWELALTGIFQRNHLVFEQKNTSQNALEAGLLGELNASPIDGGLSYWNPFSTQALNCTDRTCTFSGTPDFANTVDVLDAVNIQTHDVTDIEFVSFAAIAAGSLADLPAGSLEAAFGLEFRQLDVKVDLNAGQNACDWHEGGCGFDFEADQGVDSAFFELLIPASDIMEVTVAGRFSDYGGDVGDSFDPKISILLLPLDILSVRASWSTAFIAPTIEDLFEPEDCALQTANDPLTLDTSQSFRVACVSGNPSLQPETADVWNIGFSLSLLDGDLSLGVDYSIYDFEDRIAETTMNQVLELDFERFLAFGGTAGDPASIAAWLSSGQSDPNIQRDSFTNFVTRVNTSRLNAQEMKVVSWDFYLSYLLDTRNLGNFDFRVDATLADEYSFDLGLGIPTGDGVGSQNEDVIEVPPIPEWRVTGTLNWFLNNHSAMLRFRWTDGFDLDFNSKDLQAGQLFFNGTLKADAILYTDANYKYTFDSLFGDRETVLEVGGKNIFDEMPDPIFNLGGIESFVHDIRGRMWYARITQDI